MSLRNRGLYIESRRERIFVAVVVAWLFIALIFSLKFSLYYDREDEYRVNLSQALIAFLMAGIGPIGLVYGFVWIKSAPRKVGGKGVATDFHQLTIRSIGPKCPGCKSDTELRTSRAGEFAGRYFWGCSRYPICGVITLVDITPVSNRTNTANDA